MFIHDIEYHAPKNLEDLLSIIHEYGEDAKLLAGGTDLIVQMKLKRWQQQHVIDTKRVNELKQKEIENDHLVIGCNTTLTEIWSMPEVKRDYRALWDSINGLADRQIRNRGTLIGNICNASPAADTSPPLLVYQSKVRVQSKFEDRMIPLDQFFVGPGKINVKPDEIVTEVHIPVPTSRTYCSFQKLSRVYDDIAILNAAVRLQFNDSLKCISASIAMGAVGPTVKQAPLAEKLLVDHHLDEKTIKEAAKQAANESSPITDVRASENYRRKTIQVLVERALTDASTKSQS